MGRLPEEQRASRQRSLEALRQYAGNNRCCRRGQLLTHFGDAEAGAALVCGKCDVCAQAASGQDALRDFTSLAALIIAAAGLGGSMGSSTSKIVDAAVGSSVLARQRQSAATALPLGLRLTKDLVKELIPSLVAAGLLQRETRSFAAENRRNSITYDSYSSTARGRAILAPFNPTRVSLPPPAGLLALEAAARAKAEASQRELESAGVDTRAIPPAELAASAGATFDIFTHWVRTLAHHRARGRAAKADRLQVRPSSQCAPLYFMLFLLNLPW